MNVGVWLFLLSLSRYVFVFAVLIVVKVILITYHQEFTNLTHIKIMIK